MAAMVSRTRAGGTALVAVATPMVAMARKASWNTLVDQTRRTTVATPIPHHHHRPRLRPPPQPLIIAQPRTIPTGVAKMATRWLLWIAEVPIVAACNGFCINWIIEVAASLCQMVPVLEEIATAKDHRKVWTPTVSTAEAVLKWTHLQAVPAVIWKTCGWSVTTKIFLSLLADNSKRSWIRSRVQRRLTCYSTNGFESAKKWWYYDSKMDACIDSWEMFLIIIIIIVEQSVPWEILSSSILQRSMRSSSLL